MKSAPTTSSAALGELSPLKRALLAQDARANCEPILRADPIAIVGMGCRLPGGVTDPEAFWSLLRDGVDAVREVPSGRWNVAAVYDPDPAAPGKAATKWGGFLDQIDHFDAGFFGIVPREADRMDPQQRVFLEVAIEALDHAGLPRERLAGSRTGVFLASYYNDYAQLQYNDPEAIDARTLTGTVHSVLVNRLSYLLDLRGPSVSIDTACSSSLVAIHLACQSLRHGESDVALAGGVSLMVSEGQMIALSKVGFMAPDGRCKTFDARADGFGRGEGCSVIVLKRLAEAVADGDRVLALVRGSAVNQDGHSTVLAAPNGLAQQDLIREALANAQLEPHRVGFVEAHGTGTALGDPIEVEALAATVGSPAGAAPCYIGAAKANIGHLEAAAGATGVVKSVLVLQHEAIPAQVHFTALNPHISLTGTRLAVPTALTPWPADTLPRCIGTSGFGVGGTNAHVILEEAPRLSGNDEPHRAGLQLLPLSARSEPALRALAARWVALLTREADDFAALCACAAERRSHYEHRLATLASTADHARDQLENYLANRPSPACVRGTRAAGARLGFVFAGQGQQWLGMGRQLLETEPVFRDTIDSVDTQLRRYVPWSLVDELRAPESRSRIDETEVAQPAIFAIQIALAALWRSWGIVPDGVVGHSVGEIAALHVAGALSLDEAIRVVALRARAMQPATGRGAMATVALSAAEATALIAGQAESVSIGAINGPRSVVLSGDKGALDRILVSLERRGLAHRRLPVDYAFHSAQMTPLADALERTLGTVAADEPGVPVYSTVDTGVVDGRALTAAYFGRNVRQCVRFADAIDAMLADGFTAFLEIGAHPVLGVSIAECAAERSVSVQQWASLRRGRDETETMLQALAGAYASGRTVDWLGLQRGVPAPVLDLPAYPWQRQRHWLRERPASASTARPPRGALGLLGRKVPVAGTTVFESRWPAEGQEWLSDHRIGGRVLMPGMVMLELLHAGAVDALGRNDVELADFVIHRPLELPEGPADAVVWQVVVDHRPDAAGLALYRATDLERKAWQKLASATARAAAFAPSATDEAAATVPAIDDVDAFYAAFESIGVSLRGAFRTLRGLAVGDGTATARLVASDGLAREASAVRATLLDGALQACVAAATRGVTTVQWLPLAVDRFHSSGSAAPIVDATVRWDRSGGRSLRADVEMHDAAGALVARLDGVLFAPAADLPDNTVALAVSDPWLYEVVWRDAPVRPGTSHRPLDGAWLVLADHTGVGAEVAARLTAAGQVCHVLHQPVRTADNAAADPAEALALALRSTIADPTWRRGRTLVAVVHLWSLDAASDRDDTIDLDGSVGALHLVQALAHEASGGAQLVFVTAGTQQAGGAAMRTTGAGLWGFAAAAAAEHPELCLRLIDLDTDPAAVDTAALVDTLRRGRAEPMRLALRRGAWRVPRLVSRTGPPTPAPRRLRLRGEATLESLDWEGFVPSPLAAGSVRLRVVAAGVNFRDVLLALRMIPAGVPGAECAGIVEAVGADVTDLAPGDAVFGFAPDSLATQVDVPAPWLMRWPQTLGSLEQAASLPAAYLTAMLGLSHIAGLKPGQRVLIHAATGGVGMAALRIAQRAGCEVFATAGSERKRSLLKSMGVQHVFDSRMTAFSAAVLERTGGAGVDVVLNSLGGPFIGASVDTLAHDGCFLELGKREVWSESQFRAVRPHARYEVYDLGDTARAHPPLIREMLGALVAWLRDGSLGPLPLRVFDISDAGRAFRLMAEARHVGKLVLRVPGARFAGAPLVRGERAYWITGGLGALGLHTARWLVALGARHLVLSSRRPPDAHARQVIDELESRGAAVHLHSIDCGDPAQLSAALASFASALPPLAGIVHAAGVLDDGVLVHQNAKRFAAVLHAKAHAARHLDASTRALALDFFVLYSAAGTFLGPAGQAAYAAANAELDAIAAARREQGLPALSVGWGMWKDGGMASEMAAAGRDAWTQRGLGWIEADQGMQRLERLLREDATHAVVLPIDWHRFLARLPEVVDRDFFAELVRSPALPRVRPVPDVETSLAARWATMPESQRRGAVSGHVAAHALATIGLAADAAVDPRQPLKEIGLDSLMAVELRNALARSIGTSLPATLLFDHPTVDALTDFLMRRLDLVVVPPPQPTVALPARADAVAALSEAEAEAQLMAELDAAERRNPT